MKAWHVAAATTLALTIGSAAHAECGGEQAAMKMAMARPGTGAVATNGVSLNRLSANKLATNKLSANKLGLNKLGANRIALNGSRAGSGAVAEVPAIQLPDGTRISR
ncbi:MAG: hypothetical protein U1E70_26910 [Acetobacteraceae bacterium]|nr:hypothetical protein [Pseudomonadota bacterium]